MVWYDNKVTGEKRRWKEESGCSERSATEEDLEVKQDLRRGVCSIVSISVVCVKG